MFLDMSTMHQEEFISLFHLWQSNLALTPVSPDPSFLQDIMEQGHFSGHRDFRTSLQIWCSHTNEVGHMLSAEPVQITLNCEKLLLCVSQ